MEKRLHEGHRQRVKAKYLSEGLDEFDVLIVDEAHRLGEKSGLFKNNGEN